MPEHALDKPASKSKTGSGLSKMVPFAFLAVVLIWSTTPLGIVEQRDRPPNHGRITAHADSACIGLLDITHHSN